MEFLPGGSLDALLANRKVTAENQLKFVDFYHFARGIAVGMRHIALSGIVHRDLAARNILLDESTPPAPKIADFGFSRVVGDNEQGKTNSTVGPIKWMAPENLSSQTYSEKSDVWSYGALLVEMLTGKEPFPEKDILSIAVGVRDGKFTAIDFMPKIVKPPKWVRQMIKACFTFDVSERPSFQDLINIMNENVPEGYQINTAEEDAGLDKNKSTKTNTNKTQRTAEPHSGKSGNYDDAADLDADQQAQKTSTNKTTKGKSNYSDAVAMTEVQPSTISQSEKAADNKQGNYTSFGAQAPTVEDSKKSDSKEIVSQDSSSDSSSSGPASSGSGSDSSSEDEDSSASSSSSAESSSE
jgi:serine/threonine protein kinase